MKALLLLDKDSRMNFFARKIIIFQFVAVFVTVILTSLFLLLPVERQIAESYNVNILKMNTNLSFQIPAPGKEQINELIANSDIDSIFPYYDLFTNLRLQKRKTFSNFYIMLITNGQIESFPFTQKSMNIKIINYSTNEPVAFVDYSFAKENRLSCGDSIELTIGAKDVTAIIGAIIINLGQLMHINQNNNTEGFVIISIPDTYLTEIVEGRTIQYGGAYVRPYNYDRVKRYLLNYKPMGRLRDRMLFSTQDEYQIYLDSFNKISYAAEIRDLNNEFSKPSYFPFNNIFITLVIAVLETVLIIIIAFSNKSYVGSSYERIKNGTQINKILFPIKCNFIVVLLSHIILYLIFFYIFANTNHIYCPNANYLFFIVPFFIAFALLGAICLGIYLKIYKKHLVII